MDYLFRRKNNIIEPKLYRDPYPWIIWYIWKAQNDKLFTEIGMDPLELVYYAESECQALFDANEMVASIPQGNSSEEPQVYAWVMSPWWMGHGLRQLRSAAVDEFGRITWGRFNLWGRESIDGERLPCIWKWKHCDGR